MENWKKALKQLIQVNSKPNTSSSKLPKPRLPHLKSNISLPNMTESGAVSSKQKPDIQHKTKEEAPAT